MAHFYVYETINLPIKINRDKVLENYRKIVVSIKQGNHQINKDESNPDLGIDVENNTLNLYLSQEETSKFKAESEAKIQVNIYYDSDERDVTGQARIQVLDNLYKKVIE